MTPAPHYTHVHSPLGRLLLVSNGTELTGLYMQGQQYEQTPGRDWVRNDESSLFGQARAELAAYFTGRLTKFEVPVLIQGTAFQEQVWHLLASIPYGTTVTYGAIAAHLGDPGAARTVGYTVGRNPISVIVPCHRVLAANGALTGYNGGLERKRWLLDLEAGRQPLELA